MTIDQATVTKSDAIETTEMNETNVRVTRKVVTSQDIGLDLDRGPDLHQGIRMGTKEKTETIQTAGSKTSGKTMMTWTKGTKLIDLTKRLKKGASGEMLGKR